VSLSELAVAGSCARTCALAQRHSALKSQPRKLEAPERRCAPGLCHFNKEQTPLAIWFQIPTHGFTVVLSVFGGTPPAKPLNCKSLSSRLGAPFRSRWADPTGGKPRLSGLRIRLALADITWTSLCYRSLSLAFRYCLLCYSFTDHSSQQKTLLPFSKQGCKNPFRFVTCSPFRYPNSIRGFARHTIWIAQG
jgi:hypothetical protein